MLPTSSTTFRKLHETGLMVSFPASILEKSRMSLMMESRHSPDVRIVSRHSCCSGVGSVSSSTEAMPMTPFKGVRISWLITWPPMKRKKFRTVGYYQIRLSDEATNHLTRPLIKSTRVIRTRHNVSSMKGVISCIIIKFRPRVWNRSWLITSSKRCTTIKV